MEIEFNTPAKTALDSAYEASSRYALPDDAESVEKLVAVIGVLGRDEYLGLRSEWKARYAGVSVESRETKPQRKGGNEKARDRCVELRGKARRLMAVRHALKECARRHAATKKELAA